jgi:hypothetical protein
VNHNVIFLLTENDVTRNTINEIKKYQNPIVIPLTFKTIDVLNSFQIKFLLNEDFLSPIDHEGIDTSSYKIAQKWWHNKDLQNILAYKGINIALLPESELISSLLQFIHRICLIDKIFLRFKPDAVYFSNSQKSISRIPELFQKKYNFSIKYIDSISSEKNFRFDNYVIGFDLFGKTKEFKISRKFFFRIKKYYQKFWDILYSLSSFSKKQKITKSVLLFDFNLITHNSIVESLSNTEFGLLFFNSRRPLIWNKLSLSISKKFNFRKLSIPDNFHKVHPNLNNIINNMEKFNENNDYFSNFFSINDISFWSIYKNNFLDFCSSRFSEILFFIDSFNNLLDAENIKLLLTLDDSQPFERTAILICKQRMIPTIFSLTTNLNIFHDGKRNWKIFMINKIFADKFTISGDLSKQICLDHKVELEKLVVTGNPRYDGIFNEKLLKFDNTVLLCLSGLPGVAWSTFLSISFISAYEKFIKAIFISLSKTNRKVIIKIHPSTDTSIIDVNSLISKFLPDAKIYKNADTFELISKCDVVISPPSSVINESLILDKPVLMLKYLKNDSGIPYEKYGALLSTELTDNIDNKINQILFDHETREKLSLGRKKYLEYTFTHQGNASNELIQLIRKLIN